MSEINDFLSEAGIFYLATEDGDKPQLRPIGAHFEMDGKLLFGIGTFKNVYKQMVKNPNVQIVALNMKKGAQWLRYSGKAVFETDPKYAQYSLDQNPGLKKVYNEETGKKLGMFHLEDATAEIMGPDGSVIKKLL